MLTTISSFAQTAQEFYNKGIENVKKINRVDALENFNQAIYKDRDYSEAYYQRGLLNKHFHKNNEAKADFKKVVLINKSYIKEARIELGDLNFEEKNYNSAIKNYSEVIKIDSSYIEAFTHRAKAYYYIKKFDLSIENFIYALSIKPTDDIYFYLGLNYIEKKHWAKASDYFTKAIDLNNKNGEFYLYRASTYFSQADDPNSEHHNALLKTALADYDKALEIDKRFEEAYFERGEVKMELKDYIGAISDFKHAILIKPDDLDAHFLKAMCNYHYGYTVQAKKELLDIIKKDPKFEDALYMLGRMEVEDEQDIKAIEYFDQVLEISPDDSDSYLFRGYARLDLGDKSGACKDFKLADKYGDLEAHKNVKKYCK